MNILELKVKEFLKKELGDWDSFYIAYEDDDTSLYVDIENEYWGLKKTLHFSLCESNLCLYTKGEYFQEIDILNYNKFFWIELLTD